MKSILDKELENKEFKAIYDKVAKELSAKEDKAKTQERR